ncbi:MAG: carboxypeptidase-like regulatory domain-containing protein, partial [Bacteroidota bacterium]
MGINRKVNITALALLIFVFQAAGQSTMLAGKVVDSKTAAPIPFAHVFIAGTKTGTVTNLYGSFNMGIPAS